MFRHIDGVHLETQLGICNWNNAKKLDEGVLFEEFLKVLSNSKGDRWHHVPQCYQLLRIDPDPKNVFKSQSNAAKEHVIWHAGSKFIFWQTDSLFRGRVGDTRYSYDFFKLDNCDDWYYAPVETIRLSFEEKVPITFFVVI